MNKIKELRKEKNITVAELAKELGISQSMLTNYENGNGTPRDESIWEKLFHSHFSDIGSFCFDRKTSIIETSPSM